MVDYQKRLVEVDEILSYLSDEDYNKIPEEIIQAIQENMDQEYTWELDESKALEEQDLSRDTISILSYLNMQYLLNEEQKAYMEKLHRINELEKCKEEYSTDNKYDYSDLFKRNNKVIESDNEAEKEEETALIAYKENLFRKMINKIKSFFRR